MSVSTFALDLSPPATDLVAPVFLVAGPGAASAASVPVTAVPYAPVVPGPDTPVLHPLGGGIPVPADDQALSGLALVLAHRLRSSLGGVQAAAELLVDDVAEGDRPLVFAILEGTASMERVLADLLRYCVRVEPARAPVCLSGVAEGVLAVLDETDGLRVILDAPATLTVEGDAALLRQAVLALVQNALEATPGAPIEVAVHQEAGRALLRVSQFGVLGVTPADRVFDPFYTTKPHHLGLGLPLARRIARAHGGDVALVNNPQLGGVSFSLSLPLIAAAPS